MVAQDVRLVAMLTVVALGVLGAAPIGTASGAAVAPVQVSASGPAAGWRGSVQVGSYLLYEGPDGGLWRTDGTPSGTASVRAPSDGGPASITYLVSTGSLAYFQGEDSTHGEELWQSDGTSAGTTLVADIQGGTADSRPSYLIAIGNTVYFDAYTGPNGIDALWRSTGVGGSTTEIKMINSVNSSFSSPVNLNGQLLFTATDGAADGIELWKSDGTSDGTVMVKDIATGSASSSPLLLTVCGGRVWFRADDGTHGTEMWSTDGSSLGTQLVTDLNPGNASAQPNSVACFGSDVYFDASDGTKVGNHGDELWKSNGPTSATLAADTVPGPTGGAPNSLTVADGSLFFTDNAPVAGRELWRFTPGGSAAQVGDIRSGSSGSDIRWMTAVGGGVFFSANDGTTGAELWTSDGADTSLVADLNPGSAASLPDDLTSFGGSLYFGAQETSGGAPKLYRVGAAPVGGGGGATTPPAAEQPPAATPPASLPTAITPLAPQTQILPPTPLSPEQLAQFEVESVSFIGAIGFVTNGGGAARLATAARATRPKATQATTPLSCAPVKGAPFRACTGVLSLSLAKKGCTGTVKPPRRGSLLVAKTSYSIAASQKKTIKAPLFGAGLKLVKGKRYCIAITVSATSGKVTKTRTLATRSQKA